ncbi:MAG TPA: penicillin-binding protein 2, partial [Nocardioides sp.]
RLLTQELDVDYFTALRALRGRAEGSRFEFVARRVPSTLATDAVDALEEAGYQGVTLRDDPVRDYPADDVAANVIGFMGTDEPLGGFERTFDEQLAGTDGTARYQVGGGNRIPLGESTLVPADDGEPLRTTLDRDLQWFTQRVLAQSVNKYRAESGVAVVMDTRSGQLLSLADYPTFDANDPLATPEEDLGSRAVSDVYEPGSVQKVLTVASLIDAGKASPRQPYKVPPVLNRQDRPIGDWFDHGTLRMTLAGIIAQSSNIGTVLAADAFTPVQLVRYLQRFGLGKPTGLGVRGETRGILTPGEAMTSQTKDRVAFGQSLSVNAVQMAAAVNTIANGGVRVSPSLVKGSATTDGGREVGTDHSTATRVISRKAARQTARMMELVVDDEVGVAPGAQVPRYLVAGKTGTAQRVDDECGCYDGSTSVSFAGFAPADDPRFTVYVVVHAPGVDGGGGSIAGPAFSRIMGFALSRYGVPPTGGEPSRLPVTW